MKKVKKQAVTVQEEIGVVTDMREVVTVEDEHASFEHVADILAKEESAVEVADVSGVVTIHEAALKLGFELEHGNFQKALSTRAIQHVQRLVEAARDELSMANRIIVALGCTPVADRNQARIIAKGLAEQLIVQGLDYEPEYAMQVVAVKYAKIERTMPWCFTGSGTKTPVTGTEIVGTTKPTKEKVKRGGDKKEIALGIFNEMQKQEPKPSDSDVARKIVEETKDMGENSMSFANAFYYVTRVFQQKYSGKTTKAKKGRK